MARDPGDPTKKERDDHNATHIPFRSWCPICVKAKGREEAHRNGRGKERSCKATTLFDYKTFGEEDDRDDKATVIVYTDDHTTMIFGYVCEQKGTWVIEKIKEDIARLGYQDVILKGDGEPAVQVRRPASDRWNVDAVKAMQASPRVPNPENLRQAQVMPKRLAKKIEVEGDGSKIQEQVRRFQEFKFREFKITKCILEKFGLWDNCKGCEAAASGTGARRHTDNCQQRLEQLIRDDEVLRERGWICAMSGSIVTPSTKKQKRPEEVKVDELLWEAEVAGGKVAEDSLVNEDNIVDAETLEEETSDTSREDADKERDEGKRKMDIGEEKQNQDNKRRRLQMLASEKKVLDKFPEGCLLHSPSRHDLNRILSALEFGPTTKESCTIDASRIINAVQGADESHRDEDEEMERWRMMYEGMEFWTT